MRDFTFSADDLAANRAGKLSEDQRAALEHQRGNALIQVGALVIFFVAVLVLSCAALQSWNGSNDVRLPVGALIAAFLLMLGVRLRHMNIGQDLRGGEVVSARGSLLVSEALGRVGGRRYLADVGAARFELSESQFVALSAFQEHEPGRETVVYYTPASKTILSFEASAGAPPTASERKSSFQDALARTYAEERRKDGR